MTGFGKGEEESSAWKVTVVIRSFNGKGLDINLRIPPFMMPAEQKIRELIKSNLKRGSLQVFIEAEPKEATLPVDIDRLVKNAELLKNLTRQKLSLNISDDSLFELSWKYSEKVSPEMDKELEETLLNASRRALKDLLESRKREGEALKRDLFKRAEKIGRLLKEILKNKDRIIHKLKERIRERAKKLNLHEEHPLVVNEILFLLEKMDVEEEITRLETHLRRFKELLSEEGDVGKKLEFIAQEMHREINTLGGKIPDLSIYAVDIKTEIDRIKQQAANIE